MSIRVTLNCPINPTQFQSILPFLDANLTNVRGFKGNRRVSVLIDTDKNEMLLDEEWQSIEHHQAYMGFIDQNGVLAELSAYLSGPPKIKYFHIVDV